MKKRKILILLLTTAIIAAGAAALIRKPSLRYLIADTAAGLIRTCSVTAADSDSLTLIPYTKDTLTACGNVTFDQSMMLVSGEHPLPRDFTADTAEYSDSGVIMNTCVTEAYRALAADIAERFDEKLFIRSAYRTAEEQADAIAAEGEKAAAAGASEHQAGLALDVYIRYFAGAGFLDSDVGQYVNKNCQKHGFIIRYPYYGEESTGMGFEPWHLRYVGLPHAAIMAESRMTLEEYMDFLGTGTFYQYEDYLISVQTSEPFLLPEAWESAVLSPDNRGNTVITVRTTAVLTHTNCP